MARLSYSVRNPNMIEWARSSPTATTTPWRA
jgi:hypothetical protein